MAEVYEKGQVVIPKFIRDMFGFKPGTGVAFKVEGKRVYIEKEYDWKAEFEALCAEGKSTFEETEREIKRLERKRTKEIMDVH
jgi:AbrB family looped-hinge helix DNA binding protein